MGMKYKNIFYIVAVMVGLSLTYSIFFWGNSNTLYKSTKEDGFFEYFPVIPIWLGIMFPLNYMVSKAFEPYCKPPAVEIKECNFAFLFMVVALYLLQGGHSYAA